MQSFPYKFLYSSFLLSSVQMYFLRVYVLYKWGILFPLIFESLKELPLSDFANYILSISDITDYALFFSKYLMLE